MSESEDGNKTPDKVIVAECPMSWCNYTAVVENPDTGYEAAYEIEEHVNTEHTEKDMQTLGEPVE